MALLPEIAERIAGIVLEDCPPLALDTAKFAILDTVGVTLAGAHADSASTVLRTLDAMLASGPALLFGHRRTVDILSAALVNGTASHALDYDDCSNTMGGHPSAPILPGLWALAEARGASGAALLAAYVAGVELETRIGRAVNFHHYEKGWHPTATLGTLGAAAACARLIGLDAPRIASALALAISMASGLKANFGTMTKPFHVGQSSRNGLLAALLAEQGMTANETALEHPQGFFAVFNGAGQFAPERILENWAAPLDLIEPGIAFKRHPCCASTHPAIDALLSLRAEHGLGAADVVSIRSWTHPRRLRHTNRPDPQTGLDGKFSVQYVLARALLHGQVSLDHFSDDAVREPEVRGVMQRVEAAPHPDACMDTDEHFFAQVQVTTRAGDVFDAYVQRPLGRDRNHPLPEGTLEAKFGDCAGQVLDAAHADAVARQILALEGVGDVNDISRLLADGLLPICAQSGAPLSARDSKRTEVQSA